MSKAKYLVSFLMESIKMAYEELLVSDKKTCTKEKLLAVIEAIYTFTGSEGEGGRMNMGDGDYYAGTGLRHPSMPFHNMPKNQRRAVLLHLESKGLITITKEDIENWGVQLTILGIQVRHEYNICEKCHTKKVWYRTGGYVQTGTHSGYSREGKIRLCDCEKVEWQKGAAMSRNSNIKYGLAGEITPRLEKKVV